MSPARRLARRLVPRRAALAGMAAFGTGYVGLSVALPRILGRLTDLVVTGRTGATFAGLLGAATLVAVAASLVATVQGRLARVVVAGAVADLRASLHAKLGRVTVGHLEHRPRGDLMSRVTGDVDNVALGLNRVLDHLAWSALTTVGVSAVMFSISPLLALIVLGCAPLAVVVTTTLGRRARPGFAAQWAATGRLSTHVEQAYTGHALVRALGRRDAMVDEFDGISGELTAAAQRAWTLSSIIAPAMTLIDNLAYVLVAVVGAVRVTHHALSIGDVVSFIVYARQFNQPVIEMSGASGLLQSAAASARRVFELLDAPEESDPAVPGPARSPAGRLEFQRVTFSYAPGARAVDDLSLTVRPGQTVAIVGASGAGKTTLVNLLLRFHDPDSGRIALDGVDITAMPRDRLRRSVALVDQTTWLFHGTIAENIAYGDPDATPAAVRRAAGAAYVDRFVASLPHGYATVIDDDATNLSAGERQLIAIARALLADRAVLVLDEATSAVDDGTRDLVHRAAATLRAGRTSLVIAHRLDTVRTADLIVVMDAGRVVERGRYDDLCRAGGPFARLHAAQLSA